MEKEMTVSVIIPVYNVEKYLCECIDSVLSQTYPFFEIILVNDGSTDSSGAICDSYAQKDKRITVVNIKNSGPSIARNEGLSCAKGDFVYFLDSDDFIKKNALEELVNTAEQNRADLVFFDAVSFADDGSDVRQGYRIKRKYEPANGMKILTELYDSGDYHCSVVLLFLRKNLIDDNRLKFLETAFCSEDMLFSYKAFCSAEKAVQCNKTLYHRRCRPDSIVTSKKSKGHFRSCCYVYEDIKNYSKKSGIQSLYIAKAFVVRCAYNALNTYNKLNSDDKKKCKKEYISVKKDILSENAFDDIALKARCYGVGFWFFCKVLQKIKNMLRKGKQ